jgi:preprotein translocase subunit SecE
VSTFFHELIRAGIYKRSQGRMTRQVTFAAVAIAIAMGLWQLKETFAGKELALQFGLPTLLLVVGLWCAYRLVNVPGCADFLIAVEAEINKVSWPSRPELVRASMVVLVTIFSLAALLYFFDTFWHWLFQLLNIIP